MSAVDANAFVYALHFKIEAIEKWAFSVNESITDHAEHIDTTRACATHSFKMVSDEINKLRTSAATGELDTRKVMELVQQNDDTLKASIAGVVELLGSSITPTQADLETQAAVQTLHDHLAAAVSPAQQEPRKNRHQDSPFTRSWRL